MKIPSDKGFHLFINAAASLVAGGAFFVGIYYLWHHDWDPATAFFVWAIFMNQYVRD